MLQKLDCSIEKSGATIRQEMRLCYKTGLEQANHKATTIRTCYPKLMLRILLALPCASQIRRVIKHLESNNVTFFILWSVRRYTYYAYINKCVWCNRGSRTPNLHPLFVPKVRDKRTTKPTLDAGHLPG